MADTTPKPEWGPRGPIAESRPHTVKFGVVGDENRGENPMDPPLERVDDLFWLRDDSREKEEVLDHLRVEARYLDSKSEHLKPLAAKIYDEHIGHLKESDSTAGAKHGAFRYYQRTVKGLSYAIKCRAPLSADGTEGAEQVMLDINELAKGKSQCNIGGFDVSADHTLIAFGVDFKGDEVYEIHFLKANADGSFTMLEEEIKGELTGDVEWGVDESSVFYGTKDDVMRSDKVWRHEMGQPTADDVLLIHEADELFSVNAGKTLQGDFLVFHSGSSETGECHLLDLKAAAAVKNSDAAALKALVTMVRPREFGVRYSVTAVVDGATVYIQTNKDKAINDKIVAVKLAEVATDREWATVVIAHNADRKLAGIEIFRDFAVATGREGGLTQAWQLKIDPATKVVDGASLERIATADDIYEIDTGANLEFETATVRLEYSSLTTPTQWLDYSPASKTSTVVKEQAVIGYDRALYKCERRFATSADGTQVAMSVVCRKDVDLTTPNPTMLYGYGSYGICMDPYFHRGILPYIERGVVYVIAHIRGGAENGQAWYETHGKYLTKRNTFQDFISCAEALVKDKVTTPKLMSCEGRSAGGLLIGAVLNMRPDLFQAAVAGVPFVDVCVTMCDPSIPLTTGEWEEWGNPNEHKYHDYMLSYSPMDNIKAQPYPNLLIVAGLHDPRVAFWEPAKWASRVRAARTDLGKDVLLKIDLNAGHFSASDRYRYWREAAFEQAFILSHIAPKSLE